MTIDEAIDEILTVFKTAWDTTGFIALYTDVPGEIPATEVSWARVIVRHVIGGQSSLSDSFGKNKYTQVGLITVQVFSPIGDGSKKARELAQLVLNAYSVARGTVWYRKQQIKEVGNSGAFEQINVLTNFSYDDTR